MSPINPPINTDFAAPVGTSSFTNYLASAKAGTLTVGSEVARESATQVATMIAVIQEVQSYIDSVQSLSGFGPHSGKRLAAKFTKAGTQLGDALNGHISLLTDMANTFLYAGRLYHDSETDNASLFSSILTAGFEKMGATSSLNGSAPSTRANAMPSWGKKVTASAPKFAKGSGLAKEQAASSGKDTAAVDPENPHGQPPSFFDGVHADIDAASAGEASTMWTWMTKQLNTGVGTLHTQLQSVYNSGAWQGTGSAAAGQATVAYNGTMTNLTNDMTIIANNLAYTSGWLNDTKLAVAPSATATTAQEQQTYAQQVQAPHFQNIYVPGINNSSSAIPNLISPITPPPPTSTSTGVPSTGTSGSGNSGSGGLSLGGGGGGGGGNTGGGGSSGSSGGSGDPGDTGGSGSSGGTGSTGSTSSPGSPATGASGSATTETPTGDSSAPGTPTPASTGISSPNAGTGLATAASAMAPTAGLSSALPEMSAAQKSPLTAAEPGEEALPGEGELSGEGPLAGGAGGRLAGALSEASEAEQNLKLFPRASMAAEASEASALGRNGSGAAGEDEEGEEGEPTGQGGTRKGDKEDEDEYTRADYLSSKKYLDEAIGPGYGVTKPVLAP